MKKPVDAKVDAAVGREICLRDGAIRAMVSGRTERLGSTYVLSANLIDPDTTRVVASSSEEASSQQQVSPAVRRLSNWVRERLGEALSSIRQSDQQLEKVTTPSLRALQLYTQGETGARQRKWPVAEQLFRQALAEDPEFASAHMMLAWSLSNQKKPEDEWMPPGDRALELSERVSERERFFIQGSYYSIRRQDNKAIPIYEALLQRYPDHYWGVNNLLVAYERRPGRYEESFPVLIRSADLRPNDFRTQVGAAVGASRIRRWDVAVRYLKRANELVSPEVTKQSPLGVAYVQFSLPIEHYLRGDLETALAEVDRLARTVDSRTGQEREAFASHASNDYLWFGKLKAAEEFAQKLSPERERYYLLAGIAFARNDRDSLKKFLLDHLRYSEFKKAPVLVGLLIRAGLLAEAKKILSNNDSKDEGFGIVSQGELALAQGQTTQAITLLQKGIQSLRSGGGGVNLNGGWESLAAAYERQGDLSNTLQVLEEASQDNQISVPLGITAMRNKVRLAHLYRDLGRVEDAQKIEAELSYQLTYADADHSILRQLKHSRP
jgi:tetratricopeptide (TPR) repeat protein